MTSLKVLTYNIRKGKGASGQGNGSVAAMIEALMPMGLDLLLCQEVFHDRLRPIAQSTQLGAGLGLHTYYEPNRTRRVGHHGNATFSRTQATLSANHDISTNPVERRGALYCRLELQGRPLHVFNVHLGLNQRQRMVQVRHIGEIIARRCPAHEAVMLAGDFNDWNRRVDRFVTETLGFSNPFEHVKGRAALTWHVRRPVFCLDRIYLRHLRAGHVERVSGAPWTELSDHFPLWLELETI